MPPKVPRPPLTHFLCLPLITETSRPAMEKSLNHFKAELMANPTKYNTSDLGGSVIRPIGTIHLTLGVMSLREEEKLDAAKKLLSELNIVGLLHKAGEEAQGRVKDADVVVGVAGESGHGPAPLSVTLRSVEPMQSPTNTSILYAAPEDETGRLLPFCKIVKDAFQKADLLIPDSRPLRLHATILNTIYGSKKKRKSPVRFDANMILNEFGDINWTGQFQLEKLAICEMGAKKTYNEKGEVAEEAYKEVAVRQLPN